jgi:hypothetical protein
VNGEAAQHVTRVDGCSRAAWVGEQGPELVRLRGGERVYDARTSARLAAQPIVVNVQVDIDGEPVHHITCTQVVAHDRASRSTGYGRRGLV